MSLLLRPAACFARAARGAARAARLASTTVVEGAEGTESYRQFFEEGGKRISPWHDIPLEAGGGAYNMVTEIPKYGLAKMEVDTKGESNPIMQDTKKGKLRFYHGPIFWNYGCLPVHKSTTPPRRRAGVASMAWRSTERAVTFGSMHRCLPQTWENPNEKHPELGCFGDDDPIDVVEIGSSALEAGSVTPVKPLGVLAMIDDGELDWKVIAVATSDPLASKLNDIDDVEKECPGYVSGIREWFRWYKTPDGKPVNGYGHGERALPAADAKKAIAETHAHYKAAAAGTADKGKLWFP